ncbi:histidinol-phosphatase HisJ family protein [Clostridium sp. DJ247]|uniref:histidinol-phosphatase HisJ family protein n=1 Tax=Clostridium sp. DJ247 TaxID=2726188 RepID=UPI001625761A|nr:histidinol-phosphatase HisJ family protein [Clostridium sp. DJ247]MBC2582632.1 histidinol-phosphatase HisJ family protein [Clostridium sp. DJ247]
MKIMKADCHIHTCVSPDSDASLKEICRSACEHGLDSIIVTNHFEYYIGKEDGKRSMSISFIEDSLKEINECKVEFAEKLEVLFGMEMGQVHYWPDHVKSIVKSYPFDYLIGSIHKIEDVDLKYGDYSKENIEKLNRLYLDLLYDMALKGEYDCVGHFDLVKRYAANQNQKNNLMERYEENIGDILKVVIERGKGIEINTSGLRQLAGESMPSIDVIRLYKKLGGHIITIGSDAHIKEDVGAGIDDSVNLLKELGFKQIAVYRGRKPYFYDI